MCGLPQGQSQAPGEYPGAMRHQAQTLRHRAHHRLMAAFLEGAGLARTDLAAQDPQAAMREIGAPVTLLGVGSAMRMPTDIFPEIDIPVPTGPAAASPAVGTFGLLLSCT